MQKESKFQFCTGFWTVWTPNWRGLNLPIGKFWAQPNFRGLKAWTPPYDGGKKKYFYRVFDGFDSKVEGFKPSQREICPQPNFRGLEVWTPPMRRKTNLIFYPVLDGLDPQTHLVENSGPNPISGFEGLAPPHTEENKFQFLPLFGRFGPPTGTV
jgi:hypothetical protein